MTRRRVIDREYVRRVYRSIGLLQQTADICGCHVSTVRDIVIEAGLHKARTPARKVGHPIRSYRNEKITVGEDLLLQRLKATKADLVKWHLEDRLRKMRKGTT